jgi:hypothetical protein
VKELKSIFWVLVLIAGGFLLYKTLPAYWGNFKLNQVLSDEAIYYTNFPKSDEVIATAVSQKAQELSLPIDPEQVTVTRSGGDLTIGVTYSVHIDVPVHPFDLNFTNTATNHNIMTK